MDGTPGGIWGWVGKRACLGRGQLGTQSGYRGAEAKEPGPELGGYESHRAL